MQTYKNWKCYNHIKKIFFVLNLLFYYNLLHSCRIDSPVETYSGRIQYNKRELHRFYYYFCMIFSFWFLVFSTLLLYPCSRYCKRTRSCAKCIKLKWDETEMKIFEGYTEMFSVVNNFRVWNTKLEKYYISFKGVHPDIYSYFNTIFISIGGNTLVPVVVEKRRKENSIEKKILDIDTMFVIFVSYLYYYKTSSSYYFICFYKRKSCIFSRKYLRVLMQYYLKYTR